MKPAILCIVAAALLCATGCSAANHDFDSVVSGVEQRYAVHAQLVPWMGFVSLCARAATRGGVKDMRIAEFDHIGAVDPDGLDSLVRSQLGAKWQPMVRERTAASAGLSVIFVQPSDQSMRMFIANYDHGHLDLVRMDLNGSALARWMRNPQAQVGALHLGHSHPGQTD